jgi:hypothetical protein
VRTRWESKAQSNLGNKKNKKWCPCPLHKLFSGHVRFWTLPNKVN